MCKSNGNGNERSFVLSLVLSFSHSFQWPMVTKVDVRQSEMTLSVPSVCLWLFGIPFRWFMTFNFARHILRWATAMANGPPSFVVCGHVNPVCTYLNVYMYVYVRATNNQNSTNEWCAYCFIVGYQSGEHIGANHNLLRIYIYILFSWPVINNRNGFAFAAVTHLNTHTHTHSHKIE